MKADGPESRHLLPAMRVLTDVLGGTLQRHPRERPEPETGYARWDSYRVDMLGWKPGDEWKRPE